MSATAPIFIKCQLSRRLGLAIAKNFRRFLVVPQIELRRIVFPLG